MEARITSFEAGAVKLAVVHELVYIVLNEPMPQILLGGCTLQPCQDAGVPSLVQRRRDSGTPRKPGSYVGVGLRYCSQNGAGGVSLQRDPSVCAKA